MRLRKEIERKKWEAFHVHPRNSPRGTCREKLRKWTCTVYEKNTCNKKQSNCDSNRKNADKKHFPLKNPALLRCGWGGTHLAAQKNTSMEFLAVQGRVRGCDDADVSNKKEPRASKWPRHEITFRCQKFSGVQMAPARNHFSVSEILGRPNGAGKH